MLDDAVEEKAGGEKVRIGMVVIRGNSVVMLEVRTLLAGTAWIGVEASERRAADCRGCRS